MTISNNVIQQFISDKNTSSKYIDNYNSEYYATYLLTLSQYFQTKDIIIENSSIKKRKTDNYYKEYNNKLELLYDNLFIKIEKPIYINIWYLITELNKLRRKLDDEYLILLHKAIFNDNYELVNNTLNDIILIDKKILIIIKYYTNINNHNFNNKKDIIDKIQELNLFNQSLYDRLIHETDKSIRIQICTNYNKKYTECFNLFNNKLYNIEYIDFIIFKLPTTITETNTTEIKNLVHNKNIEKQVSELEDKIKKDIFSKYTYKTSNSSKNNVI